MKKNVVKAKKVTIIGCGWLGLPLAHYLVNKQITVVGTTTSQSKVWLLDKCRIEAKLFQLSDSGIETDSLEDIFDTDSLIIIIPFKRSFKNPYIYLDMITQLCNTIKEFPIKRIIFTSSTSLYAAENMPVSEESPIGIGERAQALFKTEEALLNLPHCETTIIRFSGLYGYTRRPGQFLKRFSTVPNPNHPINLIHLDDCISIIDQLINHPDSNLIINACSDEHPSKKDFYTWAANELNLPTPSFEDHDTDSFKIVSNKKLKTMLNYSFKYPNPMVTAP